MTTSTKTTRPAGKRQRFAREPGKSSASQEAAEATSPASTSGPSKRATKADILIGLLSRPEGATIDQMMVATAWQAHSVRGFLAGTLKKKVEGELRSTKTEAGRVYSIAAEQAAAQ
jgi:hypothetical protein